MPRWRVNDLRDGPVHPGVEPDHQQAASQDEDRDCQPHPVAAAAAPLAVTDRREHDRTPAAQHVVLANSARAFYETLSHTRPTALRVLVTGIPPEPRRLQPPDPISCARYFLPHKTAEARALSRRHLPGGAEQERLTRAPNDEVAAQVATSYSADMAVRSGKVISARAAIAPYR